MAQDRRSSEVCQVELVNAALHIIATKGITALSTRSLASQVGLSSGAIFRHFASLDELLDAVVTRVAAVIESTYPPKTLPPVERLERFIEARSSVVGDQPGIVRLILSEQFLLALPNEGSARLSACVDKTAAFVLACLRDGQRSGELRADQPAENLAPIVMGTVQMLALSPVKARRQKAETRGCWAACSRCSVRQLSLRRRAERSRHEALGRHPYPCHRRAVAARASPRSW